MLIDTEDKTAIKSAFKALVEDPNRRAELVENGFLAAQQFSAKRVAANFCKLVEESDAS